MDYLTYDEYSELGGSLDETTFNELSFEAQSEIDWVTFNRLKKETTIPDEVKKLMFRLIRILELQRAAYAMPLQDGTSTGGTVAGISSQSNDGVSISYNVLSASELVSGSKQEMAELINKYLQGVTNSLGRKLLYRGIYPGE